MKLFNQWCINDELEGEINGTRAHFVKNIYIHKLNLKETQKKKDEEEEEGVIINENPTVVR